jgi:hypothetical protein
VTTPSKEATRIGSAVSEVIEQVFGTVAEVRAAAVRGLEQGQPTVGPSALTPFPGLEGPVWALLQSPGQLAIGLGAVVAPQPDVRLPLRLQWWQMDPSSHLVLALDPDLKPSSVGFYDYAAAPWFDVPRRTGERHVVGPYVDVHGTGRYLLTLTLPLIVDGQFLGVAGADVLVSRFETYVLRDLGPLRRPFLLLNEEGRVVLSTSAQWLTGSLFPTKGVRHQMSRVPGTPWQLHLPDGPEEVIPA